MISQYAVFGHPIAHSLSPRIHAHFAQELSIAMEYVAIDVESEDFVHALQAFAERGGCGGNVTVPHKQATFTQCASLSDRALRAGSVNTLSRSRSSWHGDNTDGVGLVRDLTLRQKCDLSERRTLLLGAGGAAAGIAPALLDADVGELVIVNRTLSAAEKFASRIEDSARVRVREWSDLGALGSFELIVNATSAARAEQSLPLPSSLVSASTTAVDLGYGSVATGFLSWAMRAGCETRVDGIGMLVEQAAESFLVWHGVRPQTDALYALLRLNR